MSPLSAAISQAAPLHDSQDGAQASKPKPKQTSAAPKPSLFSDEEEDLFGGKSVEQPKLEVKKEEIAESPKPRKPVGGVSMFGGVDLFAGKRPSFTEEKTDVEKKEPVKKEEGAMICIIAVCNHKACMSSVVHAFTPWPRLFKGWIIVSPR